MRSWPGLAAVGAGLIHLGVAATSPPLLLAALAAVGGVEVLWGVLALARPSVPAARAALVASLVVLLATAAALLLPAAVHHHGGAAVPAEGSAPPAGALPAGALLGAGLLDLVVAMAAAVVLRRGTAEQAAPFRLRDLPVLALGAAGVAVVTAASLGGTAIAAHHVH